MDIHAIEQMAKDIESEGDATQQYRTYVIRLLCEKVLTELRQA